MYRGSMQLVKFFASLESKRNVKQTVTSLETTRKENQTRIACTSLPS